MAGGLTWPSLASRSRAVVSYGACNIQTTTTPTCSSLHLHDITPPFETLVIAARCPFEGAICESRSAKTTPDPSPVEAAQLAGWRLQD